MGLQLNIKLRACWHCTHLYEAGGGYPDRSCSVDSAKLIERSSKNMRRCALAPPLVSKGDQKRCSAYLAQQHRHQRISESEELRKHSVSIPPVIYAGMG